MSGGGITHEVIRIINHEGYRRETFIHDIAVLQTATPMIFTATVQPITIGSSFVSGGVQAVLSGWGAVWSDGPDRRHVDELQYAHLQVITNADCRSRMEAGTWMAESIFDSTICTFNRVGQGCKNISFTIKLRTNS